MKNHSMVPLRFAAWCLAAGAFALVSTAAFAAQKPAHQPAQTHSASGGQTATAPNPSGHAKSIAVDHAGGNGVRRMDGGNSGGGAAPSGGAKSIAVDHAGGSGGPHMDGGNWDCPLCGPRGGGPLHTGGTKTIAVSHAGGNGVRTMDHGTPGAGAHPAKADEKGATGVNPLFEGKDMDAAKPPAQPAAKPAQNTEPVEYKDPEDMTTRYRPGNNKTPAQPAAKPSHNTEPVEYKDPEDMTTRYRPGNNKTTAKSNPKAAHGSDSPH